jgi:trigger factor
MDRGPISTTVSELPTSRVRIVAEVAPDEFARAFERAARQLGRNLRVPGFRAGKVPPPLIVQRVGRAAVVERAVQDGLKRWYGAALDDAGVPTVGQPRLELGGQPGDGEPLTFSIEIGVRPTAALGRYKGLEVGRREPEVEPETIEAELQALRERLARAEAVERPAREGDLLVIDFEGTIEGEPFEGGRGRDQMVELGSGMLVAGFEEQLEGAAAGETRIVEIVFPDVESPKDHRAEDVAGSRATFTVKVKEVLAKRLPALDDDLALKAAGFETLDELREDIAAGLLAADERRVAAEFAETVLDAVAAEAAVELPDELVAGRARELWERTLRTLDYEGVGKEVYLQISGKSEDEALRDLHPQAAAELRREAVVAAVAEAEGIAVGDEELDDDAPPAPADGAPAPPPGRVQRREHRLRARVLELLAREAVAIPIDEARERELPWPREHAARPSELPEPQVPAPPPGGGVMS